jgi:hypothetical protein
MGMMALPTVTSWFVRARESMLSLADREQERNAPLQLHL